MNDTYLVTPKPPPALDIPDSLSTVEVRVIDTYGIAAKNIRMWFQNG